MRFSYILIFVGLLVVRPWSIPGFLIYRHHLSDSRQRPAAILSEFRGLSECRTSYAGVFPLILVGLSPLLEAQMSWQMWNTR